MMVTISNVQKSNATKITYSAILVGLSYVGALVKVQGSIAFDSMPAFFAAIFLGPSFGAMVGFLGHLLTAVTSGFPMTAPMHFIVAIQMSFFVYSFGWIYRRANYALASIVAILLNGPVAALMAVPISTMLQLPFSGWDLFYFLILPLILASAANVLLAVMLNSALQKRFR